MKYIRFILLHKFQTLIAFAFCLFACHLNQSEPDQVFTFTTLNDSLAKFDTAIIILKDTNGIVIDTLFHGPVTKNTNLKNLPAPHYRGGKVIIAIQGFKRSKIVYEIDKTYNTNTGKVDTTILVLALPAPTKIDSSVIPILPVTTSDSLVVKPDTVRLYLHGDSQKLTATLFPKTLKGIFKWRSSNSLVVIADDSGIVTPVS